MKRTISINLAGRPFTIDEDAYEYVENYLAKLSRHFHSTEGSDNIMDDIESRLAELIEEQKKAQPIATMEHVRMAVSILGRPEDFDAEFNDTDHLDSEPAAFRVGKKLYRDPDNKVIAGVCSGLAAYLGINDPIWVRLAFVLAFVTVGVGFIIYIVMAILVPKAKTASDFLAMKGEPINVNSIAREVEDKIHDISNQLSDIGREFRSKRKKK